MRTAGRFVVSIDLEVAWGTCDRPLAAGQRRALGRERVIVDRLLDLFGRHGVRASWAVVGHLLLEACPRRDGPVHAEIPRPVVRGERRDWFAGHPERDGDPLWYGRDLVERVRSASPAQEIGSHSFSHMPYAEGRTNRAAVRADLAEARRCHEAAGLPFSTFVFPRNVVGFRDLLAEAGIAVYRGRPGGDRPRRSRGLRRLLALAYFLVPVPARTVEAVVDDRGLVNVPASMALYTRRGPGRLVAPRALVAKATGGLDRAADRGRIFHLWLHPSNLAHATDTQFAVLGAIVQHARALADAGRLEIVTMGDVGAMALAAGAGDAR
jgi:peptidoglycan/xylan/chitin deacetylase (PgdA/CDA1 family)